MSSIEIAVIGTIFATAAVVFVYLYLYMQYRERYMGIWFLSWSIHLFRLIYYQLPVLTGATQSFLIAFQFLSICSSLLFVYGTYDFIGKKMRKAWVYGGVLVTVLSDMAIIFDIPFLVMALGTCIFIGINFVWSGIILIKNLDINGLGKYITGCAYVLLGFHTMDLPFFISEANIAPWGYIIDAVLRFVVVVGTLMVYIEKTRRDLMQKEKYYRVLAENAVDVIYRFRLGQMRGFEYISPSVEILTGYTPEEVYADSELVFKIVHPNDRTLLENLKTSPPAIDTLLTLRLIRKDQKQIWTEQKLVPIFDVYGNLIAFEGIVRDITLRKSLEQDVSRLDRLNTVGQMAANVAHEIRNPMTTVRGYLQLLGSKQEFDKYKKHFELLLEELDRTNTIISEYLSLSQHRVVEFKLSSLNKIINALFPLIQANANAANKSIVLLLGEIPDVYVDEKEIRQLILNLVRNGLEAMSSGGNLTIQTFVDCKEVVLAVQDQGIGIPQYVLDNLGKPFFTTKENGTGLGLAVCYRIANRHHAAVKVETSPSGTTFFIRFKIPTGSEQYKEKGNIPGDIQDSIKKLNV